MNVVDVAEVIKESNIIVFAPHYDDFPLMMAGYIFELKKRGLLDSKRFHQCQCFFQNQLPIA